MSLAVDEVVYSTVIIQYRASQSGLYNIVVFVFLNLFFVEVLPSFKMSTMFKINFYLMLKFISKIRKIFEPSHEDDKFKIFLEIKITCIPLKQRIIYAQLII